MNLGQPGFVPTGRKQLANPRGWGFNSANGARGRSGRASRYSTACVLGPGIFSARGPRSRGEGPSWPHSFLFCLAPGRARTTRTRTGDKGGGGALILGCASPEGPLGRFLQVLARQMSFICWQRRVSSVAPLVKVKGEKAVVESARNTRGEWATVQSGRGAEWQLHPRVGCTPQATWRL